MAGFMKKTQEYPRNGEKWNEQEEQSLKDAFTKNKSIDLIAKNHGRTSNAIFLKLKNLNLISINIDFDDYERLNKSSEELKNSSLSSEEILRRKSLILKWWELGNVLLSQNQKSKFLLEPVLDDLILKEPSIIKYVVLNLQTSNLDLILKLVNEVSAKPKKPSVLDKIKLENKKNISSIKENILKTSRFQEYKYKKKSSNTKNITTKSTERGRASLSRFGTVNPPPLSVDLSKTKTYICSMCNKPVIGNRCKCPTW